MTVVFTPDDHPTEIIPQDDFEGVFRMGGSVAIGDAEEGITTDTVVGPEVVTTTVTNIGEDVVGVVAEGKGEVEIVVEGPTNAGNDEGDGLDDEEKDEVEDILSISSTSGIKTNP